MNELFTSIYSHYLEDPLSSSLTALYNTEAPANAGFPYAVFSLVSDVLDFTFTENFENCLVQFNVFSNKSSSKEIGNLFNLFKGDPVAGEGFDFFELSLDNYETVSLQRESAILTRIEKIWQYNITYRCVLQYTGEVAHAIANKFLYNLISI